MHCITAVAAAASGKHQALIAERTSVTRQSAKAGELIGIAYRRHPCGGGAIDSARSWVQSTQVESDPGRSRLACSRQAAAH